MLENSKKFLSLYQSYGYYPKELNKVITLVPITCGVKLPQLSSSDLGIIYSGYVYFTNEKGEIVSNKIRYTGKYIKL